MMPMTQYFGVALWNDEQGTPGRRYEALMTWFPQDPAAMRCTLMDPRETQFWIFSRDVLYVAAIEGNDAGVEDGDVYVQPADDDIYGDVLIMHLTRNGRHQHILFPKNTIMHFVQKTLDKCPLGTENYAAQVDDALKRILS
jgi:hypothetical protein